MIINTVPHSFVNVICMRGVLHDCGCIPYRAIIAIVAATPISLSPVVQTFKEQ